MQELTEQFGAEAMAKGGMRIQTTIDLNLQKLAEDTVTDSYYRYFGNGAYADEMALVAIDPRTHFVKALVGGVNHETSQVTEPYSPDVSPAPPLSPSSTMRPSPRANTLPIASSVTRPSATPTATKSTSPETMTVHSWAIFHCERL